VIAQFFWPVKIVRFPDSIGHLFTEVEAISNLYCFVITEWVNKFALAVPLSVPIWRKETKPIPNFIVDGLLRIDAIFFGRLSIKIIEDFKKFENPAIYSLINYSHPSRLIEDTFTLLPRLPLGATPPRKLLPEEFVGSKKGNNRFKLFHIGLHVRDKGFSNHVGSSEFGYLPSEFRNAHIHNMEKLVSVLSERANLILLGDMYSASLPPTMQETVVEYSKSEAQSLKEDIRVLRSLDFAILGDGGVVEMARFARCPYHLVNLSSMNTEFCSGLERLVMWKNFYDSHGAVLKLESFLDFPTKITSSEFYFSKGISLVEHSTEDLELFALEVEQMMTGVWKASKQSLKSKHIVTEYFLHRNVLVGNSFNVPNFYAEKYKSFFQ
jgi:putative glycosyltransferase (TIGR04372 family)